MFNNGDTQIGTLKLRGLGETAHRSALFRRLSFLLNTVDFSPPGIPPSGILVVRRMQDPLPGKVDPHGHAHRVETAWENAARRALKEKYHTASRPVNGRIPMDSEAVFFEDESQFLAVLLLDIVNGETRDRWWWKIALKQFDFHSNLVKLLCRKITVLPAAFSHLAAWGGAPQVMNKLSEDDSLTVLAALTREFNLENMATPLLQPGNSTGMYEEYEEGDGPHLEPPDEEGVRPHLGKRDRKRGQATSREKGHEKGDRPPSGPAAPWSRWLPPHRVPAHLGVSQTALLGLGLSLYYAPTTVHTPAFARAFHRWWEFYCVQRDVKREEKQTRTDAENAAPGGPGKDKTRDAPRPSKEAEPGATNIPSPFTAPSSKEKRKKEDIGKIAGRIRFDTHTQEPAKSTGGKAPGHGEPALLPAVAEESITPGKPAAVKEKTLSLPEEGVETRLAGVFYLVNLLEQLNPPACFEALSRLESRVGAWGTLELLARALLGDRYPELESDPLWEVLAHLDNREKGTLPEEDFFINRWICFVLPYIREYLRQLVKSPAPDAEEIDIVKMVLFIDARLYVTATHVDVVMGLKDISLPVRVAGLDRNPGWKPRFARVFLFHFN